MTDAQGKRTRAVLLLLGVVGTSVGLLVHPRSAAAETPPPSAGDKGEAARKDLYGDPLPPGAVARMGTIGFRGAYGGLAFSPDGKLVLSTDDLAVRAWDVATGKLVRRTPLEIGDSGRAPPFGPSCILSRDGKILVTPEVNGQHIHIWDAATGEKRCRVSTPSGFVRGAAISEDGRTLAGSFSTPQPRGLIHLWDAHTGTELRQLRGHEDSVLSLQFSPDGKTLASESRDGTVRLWKTKTGEQLHKLRLMDSIPLITVPSSLQLAFSPNGKLLATGNYARTVKLWDVDTGEEQATLEALTKGRLATLDFSPDGKTLAVKGTESLTLWDVAARKLLHEETELSHPLNPCRFSPDGKQIATILSGAVRLRDAVTGKLLHAEPNLSGFPDWVSVLPDGKTVVSTFYPRSAIYLWDIGTGRLLDTLQTDGVTLTANSLSADGKSLAEGFYDGTLHVWRLPERKKVRRLVFESAEKERSRPLVRVCQLSPDGTRLAAIVMPNARVPSSLRVWDVRTGEQIVNRLLPATILTARSGQFTSDGRLVAIPRDDGLVLQDVATGQDHLRLAGELDAPLSFSADGQILAAGIYKPSPPGQQQASRRREDVEQIGWWELATGQPLGSVKTGPVAHIAFAPNGRVMASAGADALILWDLATGKPVLRRPLEAASRAVLFSAVRSLAFSPDGQYLISGMMGGTLLVWDVTDATHPPRSPCALDPKDLDRAWTDLAGDASTAQAAIGVLTASPAQTLALFNERLRPATDAPAERLRRLLADLDSSDFATRAAADRELRQFGDLAGPALRRALEDKPTLEVRRRIESVLSAIRLVRQPEALRRLRAVRVLEQIDSTEARQLLERLQEGSSAARETTAARDARTRIERVSRASPAREVDSPKEEKKKIPVILDTDIGTDVDDAFALALVLASPELELCGVTTVGSEPRTRALMVCRFLTATDRRDIPVAAGTAPQPTEEIAKQGRYANHPAVIFNRTARPVKETAVELLYKQLKARPGELTLLTIGPLTNIARLLKEHPDCKPWIKRIVMMGGSVRVGYNGKAPPEVEWNIKCDIPAAQAVFSSGIPLVVAPLDATTMLKLEQPLRQRLFKAQTLLTYQIQALYQLWNEQTPTLFDPVAVMLCFDEHLCTMETMRLEVDDKGMTRAVKDKANARVATAIRGEEFLKWYVDRVASAGKEARPKPLRNVVKPVERGGLPLRVHAFEDFETDIERRWWMSGKPETADVPPGSRRAGRGVLTQDFDDLMGDMKTMYTAVIFNPVPGPPMGPRTRLSFRYRLQGTDTLRVQIYSLTNGYHRYLALTGLPQGRWESATVDMTMCRRPDGSGGPLSADERIDDIQFYVDPAAELLIDDIVLYEAAPEGEKRPFPRRMLFTGWFDTGKQGKEWPGDFEIVPHKPPQKWKAAKSILDPKRDAPWIRLDLRGERTLGAKTHLRFRYHVSEADSMQIALVQRKTKERHILDVKELRKGEWAEAMLDFTKQTRAGQRVDEIQFLLPKGAELLIDDLLLYEPGAE